MKTKFAFLCATPLHLLNAVNFVMNDEMGSKGCSDLYVSAEFRNAREEAARIKELALFQDVYIVGEFAEMSSKLHRLYSTLILLFPKAALKRHAISQLDFHKQYEYICYASPDIFFHCCKCAFKYEKMIGIDDGLSSYSGNIYQKLSSNYLRIFDNIFLGGKILRPPEKLYLNNPGFHEGEMQSELLALPEINIPSAVYDALMYVFQYRENDLYRDHKIVYLTQHFKKELRAEAEQEVLRILQQKEDDLLIRVHPSQSGEQFEPYAIDTINNMWELECIKQITEENVLVGISSTAQIFPKLIFGKEPRIIFLYELLLEREENGRYMQMKEIAERFTTLYRNKDRIYIPETMEELKRIVDSL